MIGGSNNLRFNLFLDPVGHFGLSRWLGIAAGATLQAVSECRYYFIGIGMFIGIIIIIGICIDSISTSSTGSIGISISIGSIGIGIFLGNKDGLKIHLGLPANPNVNFLRHLALF